MPSPRRALVAAACLALLAAVVVSGCDGSSRTTRPVGTTVADALLADVEAQLALDPEHDLLRAVVVRQDGRTVAERYHHTDAQQAWDVESVTKSVVSLLVGIALDEGLIRSLDARLGDLLPRHRHLMTPAVARTTLRQLMSMTAGASGDTRWWDARMSAPDPVAAILRHDLDPRQHDFVYSNLGAHLVAAVLQEAVGGSVLDFARDRLFGPLGIDTTGAWQPEVRTFDALTLSGRRYADAGVTWPVDRAGVPLGESLLKLRPRDLARLGELVADGGTWHGRRIVSAAYLEQATRAQVVTHEPVDYGLQWWVGQDPDLRAAYAFGYGGQMVAIVPRLHLVVVVVTAVDYAHGDAGTGFSRQTLTFMVDDVVVPALSP